MNELREVGCERAQSGRMVENRGGQGKMREWQKIDKESRCRPRERQEGKREIATEMGGLREKRRQECRSRRKLDGKRARRKRMEENSSEGD